MENQYHILENLFPPEIVNIILHYNKQSEAKEIIKHYTNLITNKTSSLKFLLKEVLNSYNISHSFQYNLINLNNELLFHLKRVINSNYSREKYSHYFWLSLINIFSRSLMNYYNYLLFNNKTANTKLKNNKSYILLKKTIVSWFKLCLKHNVNLALYINNKTLKYKFIYVNSKNIEPLHNFNKFLYAPLVYDDNMSLDYMFCKSYLSNYLLIM
jgi:hypothetical protein